MTPNKRTYVVLTIDDAEKLKQFIKDETPYQMNWNDKMSFNSLLNYFHFFQCVHSKFNNLIFYRVSKKLMIDVLGYKFESFLMPSKYFNGYFEMARRGIGAKKIDEIRTKGADKE